MTDEKQTPYKKWYENNKETLSERRKKRYREDPEYRQAYLDRKAKQTAGKKAEPVDPKYTHNFTQATKALGVSMWTLRNWRDKGLIPEPHEHHKALYFTSNQVALMAKLKAKFDELGKSKLTAQEQQQVDDLADLIRANWE